MYYPEGADFGHTRRATVLGYQDERSADQLADAGGEAGYLPCMNIPKNMTEAEVLMAIEEAVRVVLPGKIHVPGYAQDDLAQEMRLYALQALEKYDPRPDQQGKPTRPLLNFLVVHCRYRTLNLRRKLFRRADSPCRRCHAGTPCGEDGRVCRKYAVWAARNDRKASLA